MKSLRRSALLLILTAVSGLGCKPDPAVLECEKVRKDALERKIDLTQPKYEGEVSTWEVIFGGQGVRFPTGEWDIIPQSNEGGLAIVLAEKNGDVVMWSQSTNALKHDELVAAFATSAKTLVCEDAAEPLVVTQVKLLKALLDGMNPEVVAAHYDTQGRSELTQLTFSAKKEQWGWHVWLPGPHGYLQLSYHSSDEERVRSFAATGALGTGEVDGPSWAKSLSGVVEKPTPEAWADLKENGLP